MEDLNKAISAIHRRRMLKDLIEFMVVVLIGGALFYFLPGGVL